MNDWLGLSLDDCVTVADTLDDIEALGDPLDVCVLLGDTLGDIVCVPVDD